MVCTVFMMSCWKASSAGSRSTTTSRLSQEQAGVCSRLRSGSFKLSYRHWLPCTNVSWDGSGGRSGKQEKGGAWVSFANLPTYRRAELKSKKERKNQRWILPWCKQNEDKLDWDHEKCLFPNSTSNNWEIKLVNLLANGVSGLFNLISVSPFWTANRIQVFVFSQRVCFRCHPSSWIR